VACYFVTDEPTPIVIIIMQIRRPIIYHYPPARK